MARGMVQGEPIVSQANTAEFDAGYDRIFGPDRKPTRGKWVLDKETGKLVPIDEYVAPVRALDAPIMMDRFYENTASTDGVDIGSRRKHREYMKSRGYAPADDFSPSWYENTRKEQKREQKKQRRQALEQALYRMHKP